MRKIKITRFWHLENFPTDSPILTMPQLEQFHVLVPELAPAHGPLPRHLLHHVLLTSILLPAVAGHVTRSGTQRRFPAVVVFLRCCVRGNLRFGLLMLVDQSFLVVLHAGCVHLDIAGGLPCVRVLGDACKICFFFING